MSRAHADILDEACRKAATTTHHSLEEMTTASVRLLVDMEGSHRAEAALVRELLEEILRLRRMKLEC